MKRLFLLFSTVLIATSAIAETVIQNTFIGLKLGKASKTEVLNMLSLKGFELQSDTGDTYVYNGNWQIEGVPVNRVVASFLEDTLSMIAFGHKSCMNNCDSLELIIETNIESKYGMLQSGDSSFFLTFYALKLDSLYKKQWSRMDDKTTFLYAKSDSGYITCYLAERYIWNKLLQTLNSLSSDYAEENKVTGVAGVKFGDSKESVRRVILAKAQQLLESDAHSLNYYKVKIGGMTYDYATFYFTPNEGLIAVNMQCSFYSWRKEEALMAYENVISQYRRKYTNFKVVKDEFDEKSSVCGAFTDGYEYLPIYITFQKSLSKGGDMMYYVQVDYYLNRISNLYDDEI